MRIALINPPSLLVHGQAARVVSEFPLGLGYIAAYARRSGHVVKIFDPELFRTPLETMWLDVKAFSPDIVGVTSVTPTFTRARGLAEDAKRLLGCLVVMGGPHVTALPRSTLLGASGVDAVIRGEGETSMLAIAAQFDAGGRVDFSKVPGASFLEGGQYRETARPGWIADLDDLPKPARDLVDFPHYSHNYPSARGRASATIITSRGCPSQCTFCANIGMGRKFRAHSAAYVVEEMSQLKEKYGIKHFKLVDDCFTADPARVHEICDRLIASGLNVTWFAAGRVNTLRNEALIVKMKKAGCLYVSMGIETGSQRINDLMRKGTTLEMAEESCALLRRHGVGYVNSFIIGNEGDTGETVRETVAFAKKLKSSTAIFNMLIPYPGTPLFEKYYADYDRPDTDWSRWCSEGADRPYEPRQTALSTKDILRLTKRAYISYSLRPAQLWRTLLFALKI